MSQIHQNEQKVEKKKFDCQEFLGEQIGKIDHTTRGEAQTWLIKRVELNIQLEIARQLKRIADTLELVNETGLSVFPEKAEEEARE